MVARTNCFRVLVQILMRIDAADVPDSLCADRGEQRDFPVFEGGFFGNIFLERSEAYVCTSDGEPGTIPHLRSLLCVCSLPLDGGANAQISRCGFLIAGPCASRHAVQTALHYWAEVPKNVFTISRGPLRCPFRRSASL